MPPLSSHPSSATTKLLVMGHTGRGKTGALASLAAAGYNLRILDFDNGLDVLRNIILSPKSTYPKECLDRISYIPLQEDMEMANGKAKPLSARTFSRAMGLLDNWIDGEIKLGGVKTWTPQDILVIDTLSFMSEAALYHIQAMNSRLGHDGSGFHGQADIGAAQRLIRGFLETIKSPAIKCNVIINAHIIYTNEWGTKPKITYDDKGKVSEIDERQGFPKAIGRALSPDIGTYFNTMLELRLEGQGPMARSYFYTKSQGEIACKNTNPLEVKDRYSLETGLADYFKDVQKAAS